MERPRLLTLADNMRGRFRVEAERKPEGMPLGCIIWVSSLLVLLLYSVTVMLWLPRPDFQASRTFLLHDKELQRHLNLPSSLTTFTTSCEKFLVEEGRDKEDIATESEAIPSHGWSGGEWHYSWLAETDHSEYDVQHQKNRRYGRLVGDQREATFSVKDQTAHNEWLEWSSKPLKPPIHAVEGLLVLKNFDESVDLGKDFELVYTDSAPELKQVDFNQMLAMRNLKIFLKGVGIVGERLCMIGCAFRNEHSFRIDCGFVLKMTYPNRHSMTSTRQIEAELSSARTGVNDPLRFPAIRIVGSNFTVELE
ncbi:hypothetical protein KC19_5G079500 [Ceratodon purpureus]|uniref:Uncharacterized protein n=1 Tax=Ceratodon purpureus TaxID=3225 RepID=A0A8T0I0J9_CERPU|nr:hypothetical protein KC19_5G079500 [Ceratodon purpureus]